MADLALNDGSLFGIDGLKDDLKEAAILGASAAGAIVLGNLALANLPWIKEQDGKIKGAVAIALGVGGGIVIGRYANRGAGAGFAAGLIGVGLTKLLGEFVPSMKFNGLGDDDGIPYAGLGRADDSYFQGLGAGGNESALLLGVNEHAAIPMMGVDERPAGQFIGAVDDGTVTMREGGEREEFSGVGVSDADIGTFLQA